MIIVVGTLPPPVNGAAVVTQSVVNKLLGEKLARLYDPRLRTMAISNLAFIEPLSLAASRASFGLTEVGYLSNISFEKGIDRFLDLVALLRDGGSRLSARIAGPFDNDMV